MNFAGDRPLHCAYFERILSAWDSGQGPSHVHFGCFEDQAADASLEDAQIQLNRRLIEAADLRAGQHIADVACGLGGLVEQLNERLSDVRLSGVNIDSRQLEICSLLKAGPSNLIRWHEADAVQLPFPDSSVDRLFCVEAMFHFSSREAFVHEAARVLVPGGKLMLADITLHRPDETRLPPFAIEAVISDGYGPWPDPWCRNGTAEECCHRADLQNIRVIDITSETLPTWDHVLPAGWSFDRDPGTPSERAALLLAWMHTHHLLAYNLVTAEVPAIS